MYIREVRSRRKHGPGAVYLQLVAGYRDPETGKVKTRNLHSFGRKEEVDLCQLRRPAEQCLAYLGPEEAGLPEGFEITGSWTLGGPHLLDRLWRALELDGFFRTSHVPPTPPAGVVHAPVWPSL